jgi:hypothetical protein
MPLASVVLPAPRSPLKKIISPGRNIVAISAPKVRVTDSLSRWHVVTELL